MRLRIKLVFALLLIHAFMQSQPPCNTNASTLITSPNLSMFCVGDAVSFTLSVTGSTVISGNVSWSFGGTANNVSSSGPKKIYNSITGLQTGGVVTASGILNVPSACTFNKTFNVNVSSANGLTANAGSDAVYNSSAVSIGGSCASGGASPYTYQWTPGNINICGPSVSPATSTIYTLQVTDANNCKAFDYVTVLNFNSSISYIVPTKELDGGYQVVQSNRVYFMVDEEYNGGSLQYRIIDYNPSSVNAAPTVWNCGVNSTTRYLGDNRYYIDLSSICAPALASSKFYVVELWNDKKEKLYFKFYK